MTILQFRQSSPLVLRMREILSDPTMQEALMAVKDANLPIEPDDSADPIVSVRRHSRGAGVNAAIATLLSMSELLPPPLPEEEPTYASDV